MKDLKAVFFVKDNARQAARQDIRGFLAGPGETIHGRKVCVRFKDGELLCAYSLSYSPERTGFFMYPADRSGNNERVYVVTAATRGVEPVR